MRRAVRFAIAAALAAALPAAAQGPGAGTRTMALDTVVGVQDYVGDAGAWKTQLIGVSLVWSKRWW